MFLRQHTLQKTICNKLKVFLLNRVPTIYIFTKGKVKTILHLRVILLKNTLYTRLINIDNYTELKKKVTSKLEYLASNNIVNWLDERRCLAFVSFNYYGRISLNHCTRVK